MRSFYEFFAGGGMARLGLGDEWCCLFANDFDEKKSATYRQNWGSAELKTSDVRLLTTKDLPGRADLVWGSFPCQDLSLAGGGAGLQGHRSGTFWPFWSLIGSLSRENRAPKIVVLENVCGALTSHGGRDFSAICEALADASFQFGAVVMDALSFIPQSRPRLFVIGVRDDLQVPEALTSVAPLTPWHSRGLQAAYLKLEPKIRKRWHWWSFPTPQSRNVTLGDLIEENPSDVKWHTPAETNRLVGLMSEVNRAKLEVAQGSGRRMVGCVYKRTRKNERGEKVQRAEIRFDDVAGCLRTPAGGSSRQLIIVVEKNVVRSRLISGRETARLMGLPENYQLPVKYNDTYHLTGDGVAVPVVRHLSKFLLEPLLELQRPLKLREAAA